MKIYYLYHHIREDNNEVFYVGIGKIYSKNGSFKFKTDKSKYSRAYYINNRTEFWKNIVNKVNYIVEIILESNDLDFIISKEIEHITFYGRKDMGLGTLVNLTDGGEGSFNCSESTRKKMSLAKIGKPTWNKGLKNSQVSWNKGKKLSEEHIKKSMKNLHINNMKKICCLNQESNEYIIFESIKATIKYFNVSSLQYYIDKNRLFRNKFILTRY